MGHLLFMAVLAMRKGLFGPISVVNTQKTRKLTIGTTTQGGACLAPSSTDIYPDASPGPGPVLDTAYYQLAWLLAGQRHPGGHGLMVGLGGGTGAVALLYHFPHVRLDVVERDPVIVSLAREYFPLVRYFEQKDRLRIITADASDYLATVQTPYTFALADIYTDQQKTPATMQSTVFAELVLAAAEELWFNTINSLDRPFLHRFLQTLDGLGHPVHVLLSPVPRTVWLPIRRNWILSTADLDGGRLDAFTPYPDLAGSAVTAARTAYRILITNCLTRAEARLHAERRHIALPPG